MNTLNVLLNYFYEKEAGFSHTQDCVVFSYIKYGLKLELHLLEDNNGLIGIEVDNTKKYWLKTSQENVYSFIRNYSSHIESVCNEKHTFLPEYEVWLTTSLDVLKNGTSLAHVQELEVTETKTIENPFQLIGHQAFYTIDSEKICVINIYKNNCMNLLNVLDITSYNLSGNKLLKIFVPAFDIEQYPYLKNKTDCENYTRSQLDVSQLSFLKEEDLIQTLYIESKNENLNKFLLNNILQKTLKNDTDKNTRHKV